MSEDRGKTLIIGATGGIGRALTARLDSLGTNLVLAARSEEALRDLADEHGAAWDTVEASDFDAVQALFKKHPNITRAVNLAGSMLLRPAHLTGAEALRETMRQNVETAFALVGAAGKAMRSSGGSIVLMSSCAARVGLANHEAIAAAKAAVEGLTRAAAATYAPSGIRINAVAPGLVDTPLASGITNNDTALEASIAMHPLGRIGQADEIARVIEFLLDADSDWITGQVLGVDGGLASVRPRPEASARR